MATIQKAIEDAQNCHQICLETINYCLEKGGDHAKPSHISLLSDCADICMVSTRFMMKQSEFQGQICGICADICAKCADSCDQFGDDDQMMNCAEVCRQCESSCRSMSTM